jgi:hypothetical protein
MGAADIQGAALTFVELLLLAFGGAVAVGVVIIALVYAGNRQESKRYRPGRPFEFRPVWFLAAPDRQVRTVSTSRELVSARRAPAESRRSARAKETGGASDRW